MVVAAAVLVGMAVAVVVVGVVVVMVAEPDVVVVEISPEFPTAYPTKSATRLVLSVDVGQGMTSCALEAAVSITK